MLSTSQRHWLDFVSAMTEKEIKTRYKYAALGFLWIVLNPLLQMIVIGFVFQFFVPVKVDNYFIFLFTGLLPWNFFSYSVTKCTPAIVYERTLIQKARFPREAIILSLVLSNLFHLLISLGLFIVFLTSLQIWQGVLSGREVVGFSLRMLGLLPLLGWLTLVTAGLSLGMSAFNVKYRDTHFLIQALMPLWFYATPILYTLNLIPPMWHHFFYLNPMTFIIQAFQALLLGSPWPTLVQCGLSIGMGLVITAAGVYIFRKESPFFDDWV